MLGREIIFNIPGKSSYGYEFFPSWSRVERTIRNREEVCVILPLYAYDLGGFFEINLTPYPNEWESGQCGYVVVSKQEAREFLGTKRITQKNIQEIKNNLYERYNKKSNSILDVTM